MKLGLMLLNLTRRQHSLRLSTSWSLPQQRVIPTKIVKQMASHELAATLMTKGLTTNYLLTKTYKLRAGETVLLHAAAGGVGQIFVIKYIGRKL